MQPADNLNYYLEHGTNNPRRSEYSPIKFTIIDTVAVPHKYQYSLNLDTSDYLELNVYPWPTASGGHQKSIINYELVAVGAWIHQGIIDIVYIFRISPRTSVLGPRLTRPPEGAVANRLNLILIYYFY